MPALNIIDVIAPSLVMNRNLEKQIRKIIDEFEDITEFEISDDTVTYHLDSNQSFFISIDTTEHSVVMQIEWNETCKKYILDLLNECLEDY